MFLQDLHQVNTLIFDIDGVLTNGSILVTEAGEQLRTFNTKDGYAMQLAVKKGLRVVSISGVRSKGVLERFKGLGITDAFIGINNKLEVFDEYVAKHRLKPEHILYMGDDIPDLQVMKLVGFPVCPADAAEEIKAISKYISPKRGGEGCVRDIIEKILKIQDKWHDDNPSAQDGSLRS